MSCNVAGLSRCEYYYRPKKQDDTAVIKVLNGITSRHLRWGFPKCYNRIRKLGYQWNHKRVYRIYCELGLNLRTQRKNSFQRVFQHRCQRRINKVIVGQWIL